MGTGSRHSLPVSHLFLTPTLEEKMGTGSRHSEMGHNPHFLDIQKWPPFSRHSEMGHSPHFLDRSSISFVLHSSKEAVVPHMT
jgi:hypothetical protein